MNRETKLRSWNKYRKQFTYFVDGRYFYIGRNNREYQCSSNLFMWENAEWFTGIKDKNGIEVYEGDYLVDRYPINDEDLSDGYNESLMPVVWCNKKHCWCIDVTFAKNGTILEPIYSYFGDSIEVKGNINQKTQL